MLLVDGVEMLEVRAAADYVGRTPETVRRWVWSGRVSSVRRGNRLLVPRSELDGAVAPRHPSTPPVTPSLGEWAARVPRRQSRATGRTAPTAADLVRVDRESDDHGR